MPNVRNTSTSHRATNYRVGGDFEYTSSSRPSAYRASASSASKSPKRKKPSNAFFLYRSYVIANGLLPDDIKHQNDASRMAALMWKGESAEVRMKFFAEAEKKKEEQKKEDRELELALTPCTPTLSSPSTSSFPNSSRASSPATPRTPNSPFVQTPTTPKGFTPRFPDFLPQSPSPSRPSQPSWHLERTLKHESFPEINYDEPLLFALSDEWACPIQASSLSLMQAPDEIDPSLFDDFNDLDVFV